MTTKVTDASPASDQIEDTAAPATDTAAPESGQDAPPAQSSGADATDANSEPKSLRDVVESVVKAEAAPAESSTVEAEEGKSEADPASADEAEGGTDADNVPFHNHPRWKAVIAERDAYKGDADQFRTISSFMEQNRLSGDEVAEGFQVMALLKSGTADNLQKARDWFATRLQALDEHLGTGDSLPDDLQRKVEDGLIDGETAREVAQARARARLAEQRVGETEAEAQSRLDRESRQAAANELAQAAASWEQSIKAKDPDYAKKAALVEAQVKADIQSLGGKPPMTAEETVQMIQGAYDKVNTHLKAMLPKPRAVEPAPVGVSAATRPEPKSLREAVEMAVNR